MREDAIVFGSETRLMGVVTDPSGEAPDRDATGVIFLNAGLVHRVGPNRIYVTVARDLASNGFVSLRFDHSGIGDSPAADDERAFGERFVDEVRQAMDWLAANRACERFVLVGLCSGTLTAFNAARADARVTALVLLTALLQDPSTVPPEVVAEASDRRVARSYVTAKVGRQATWRRVLAGEANYRNALRTGVRLVARQTQRRAADPDVTRVIGELRALLERGVHILFIFAEPTTVLEYFRMTLEPALDDLRRVGRIEISIVKRADHTFSRLRDQKRLTASIGGWLSGTSAKM